MELKLNHLYMNKTHKFNPFVQNLPSYYVVLKDVNDSLGESWVKFLDHNGQEKYLTHEQFTEIFTFIACHDVKTPIADHFGVNYTKEPMGKGVYLFTNITFNYLFGIDNKYLTKKSIHFLNKPYKYFSHKGWVLQEN